MSAEFSHGLFGCFDNLGICIVTYFVPCYTAGKNAEATGKSCVLYGLFYTCFPCIEGGMTRTAIREQKGIAGSLIGDIFLHLCCSLCALSQEAMEVTPQAMVRE
ncbi:cell number regulator 7 [Octopus sinensis]|uniref:Cell number regulator 7 n=1 Tax=Octopus sinensis TaxID=2607531 RepID=A0A6P7SS06_9MOLL|nr:cell number regulator 7 [Octopus sinensis]